MLRSLVGSEMCIRDRWWDSRLTVPLSPMRGCNIQEVRGADLREYKITSTQSLGTRADAAVLLLTCLLVLGKLLCGLDSTSSNVCLALATVYLVKWAMKCSSFVREESVVVIQDFGIQKKVTFASGRKEYKFLAKPSIQECIVNEAIVGFSVVFYVAFMVADQADMELSLIHI
eukprot:TRINITY_DN1232_c0_g1_i5.p1 TRINITY_DN1232_c0_g1~~TRINITY_DN1232_c0_g1_i5.p1  ORF type:complete len:173 (-),score=44.70 TRINITY_DN1232_c0_g1_i5:43-561(-)